MESYLLLSFLIGKVVSDGIVTKNYKFHFFSESFLDSSSVKTEASDQLGKFT